MLDGGIQAHQKGVPIKSHYKLTSKRNDSTCTTSSFSSTVVDAEDQIRPTGRRKNKPRNQKERREGVFWSTHPTENGTHGTDWLTYWLTRTFSVTRHSRFFCDRTSTGSHLYHYFFVLAVSIALRYQRILVTSINRRWQIRVASEVTDESFGFCSLLTATLFYFISLFPLVPHSSKWHSSKWRSSVCPLTVQVGVWICKRPS